MDTRYDDRLPAGDPWHTYGPLGGATRLLRVESVFTGFDRPVRGPDPYRYPGYPLRSGPEVSLWESTVTFRVDQIVKSLQLFHVRGYRGPFPVRLLHGRGKRVLATLDLSPGKRPEEIRVKTGDWIGCYGPEGTNLSWHLNLGAPIRLKLRDGQSLGIAFLADLEGRRVAAHQRMDFSLLSVVDPLDAPTRDADRVRAIARRVLGADGIRIRRGQRVVSPIGGLLDLRASNGSVAITARRPAERTGLPLPVRVSGLNPRWSAGILLAEGHVAGGYDEGRLRYRATGFDSDGRIWATFHPDERPVTRATLGHPVVCDRKDLFVQVTARDSAGKPESWHVAVNNPTEATITATLRQAMPLPGLLRGPVTIEVPPGARVVLQGDPAGP